MEQEQSSTVVAMDDDLVQAKAFLSQQANENEPSL